MMESMAHKVRDFLTRFNQKNNQNPMFVPVSREELTIFRHDEAYVYPEPLKMDSVYGVDSFITPFAEPMRQRQVEVPMCCVTSETAEAGFVDEEIVKKHLRMNLIAYVCSDDTKIEVSLEWDPWRGLKRALRLTKWFPVKRKNLVIKGSVLYPYLNIRLPHNRHHVRFLCK